MAKNAILLISGIFAHLHTHTHIFPYTPLYFSSATFCQLLFSLLMKKSTKKFHRMRDRENGEKKSWIEVEKRELGLFLYIKNNFCVHFLAQSDPCLSSSVIPHTTHCRFFFLNIFMHFFSSTKDFFSCIIYLLPHSVRMYMYESLNFFYIIIIEG